MIKQKYVRYSKRSTGLLGESGSPSYMAAQCYGQSGLEQDLMAGWIVKHVWEDSSYIVFILERNE